MEFIQTLMPYCIELATLTFTNIKFVYYYLFNFSFSTLNLKIYTIFKFIFCYHRVNLLNQISNLSQTQKYSSGDLANLKIFLSMSNNHSSLEFSPITCNLPILMFDIIPPCILSVLTKWHSFSTGPQLMVSFIKFVV